MIEDKRQSTLTMSAYIHIPFCEHICYYCDFNKVFLEGQPVDEYVEMLLNEMRLMLESHPTANLETLYVGGGTPTSLSAKQLEDRKSTRLNSSHVSISYAVFC